MTQTLVVGRPTEALGSRTYRGRSRHGLPPEEGATTNRVSLRLDEMMPEASVESSHMASAALSTDELLQRVKGMVGKADYTAVVPTHPDQGYVSLMSLRFLPLFPVLSFLSYPSHPFRRGCEASEPPVPRF